MVVESDRQPIFPPPPAPGDPVAGASTVRPPPIPVKPLPVQPIPVQPLDAMPGGESEGESSARRFCTTCGAPWDPAVAHCQPCSLRASREPQTPLPADGGMGPIRNAVSLYFTMLAACVVALVAGFAGSSEVGVDIALSIGLTAIVLVWTLAHTRQTLPLLTRIPAPRWWLLSIGLAFVTYAIAWAVISGVVHLLDLPEETLSTIYLEAGYGWGMVVLLYVVQPAIVEELAFRGIMTDALLRTLSPLETVLVTALMFMVLHLSPARFPHTLAMGLAAGYLRVRTGTLYPCFILHAVHNGLCVAAEWAEA